MKEINFLNSSVQIDIFQRGIRACLGCGWDHEGGVLFSFRGDKYICDSLRYLDGHGVSLGSYSALFPKKKNGREEKNVPDPYRPLS